MTPTRRQIMLGCAALALQPAGALWAEPAAQVIGGAAFGGIWRLVLPAGADALRARRAVQRALARVDAAMSPWRADTEVARFNASRSTGWHAMSAPTLAVTAEAQDIARLTGGRSIRQSARWSRATGSGRSRARHWATRRSRSAPGACANPRRA